MTCSRTLRIIALCAALLCGFEKASAQVGAIEINQAVIAAQGGYPFRITSGGSYVLTGNLRNPAAGNAIEIRASQVIVRVHQIGTEATEHLVVVGAAHKPVVAEIAKDDIFVEVVVVCLTRIVVA